MGIIIKEIKISKRSYTFISREGEEGFVLKNLSKINIFVGTNNSGKSRFMRSLIFNNNVKDIPEFIPNYEDFKRVKKGIFNLKKQIPNYLGTNGLKQFSTGNSNLKEKLDNIKEFDFITANINYIKPINELKEYLDELSKISDTRVTRKMAGGSTQTGPVSAFTKELIRIFNESFDDLNLNDNNTMNYKFNKIYIPILRGLRDINEGNDVYFNRTLRDYFPNIEEKSLKAVFNIEIFTGLKIYQKVKNLLLGDLNERKLIMEFEEYLSKYFFENESIALIPKESGTSVNILTIKIGNEHEMPIYNLGDGIQSIIAITLPLFLQGDVLENKNVLVCIEEPEHLLHPSLQRKLIETFFDKRFDNFQFFFTTHSNHFLDVVLDFDGISMFTFDKKLEGSNEEELANFKINNVNFGDDNLLNMLGVRNSSVFLPNCNIWVEGISDVLYFRDYLDIYQEYKKTEDNNFKKFREDLHYSFYKYDGSDIKNLLELDLSDMDKRLDRVFLIRDRDAAKDKNKKKTDKELKILLGDKFCLLNCREVENLLIKSVILKILEHDKNYNNISLNKNFEYENYKNLKLKNYIKDKICKDPITWNPIGSKTVFYKKAKKHIKNWNDLFT